MFEILKVAKREVSMEQVVPVNIAPLVLDEIE
jgi:hypothetical protein